MTGRNTTDKRKAYNKALHAKRWAEDPAYRDAVRATARASYAKRKDDPEHRARIAVRQALHYARRKAANGGVHPPKASNPAPRRQCVECGALHAGRSPRCGACRS